MIGLEATRSYRPRLVFGHVDSAHAAQCSRFLRRQGWEVHLVTTAEEVHGLVHELKPDLVVVDLELPDETGWLTCAKNILVDPLQSWILLSRNLSEQKCRWAKHLGAAALISRAQGPEILGEHIQDLVAVPVA